MIRSKPAQTGGAKTADRSSQGIARAHLEQQILLNPPQIIADRPTPPAGDLDSTGHDASPRRLRNGRKIRLFWPVVCAACAAAVATIAGGFDHFGTLRLEVQGSADLCRKELLDFLWQREHQGSLGPGWSLTCPSDGATLHLRIPAVETQLSDLRIRNLVHDFKAHLGSLEGVEARKISAARNTLDGWIEELHRNIDRLRPKPVSPETDPLDTRNILLKNLTDSAATYTMLRDREDQAAQRVLLLDTRLPTTQVQVSPQQRGIGYARRTDLEQDMKQLTVQLTLARRSLEGVWQNASPSLDELIAAASRLGRIDPVYHNASAGGDHRTTIERFLEQTGHYRRRLAAFAPRWTGIFTKMRRQTIDPLAPRLFDTQNQLHELLSDFAFYGDRLLGNMRSEIRALDERPPHPARSHALVSQIKRAFNRLESQHLQFEFVASDVLRRNNFRLDSAVRSARGLHRRIQHAVAEVDDQLEAEALAKAKEQNRRQRRLAAAELEQIRREATVSSDATVEMLSELLASIPKCEQSLRSSLLAGADALRRSDLQTQLAVCENTMESLDTADFALRRVAKVEIIDYTIERSLGDVPSRVYAGFTAGFGAFAIAALLQIGWRALERERRAPSATGSREAPLKRY